MAEQVIEFIRRFRFLSPRDEIVTVFTCGCCYWFAFILCERFNGVMMYDPVANHFAAGVGSRLYDITGDVTERLNASPWDEYEDEIHKKRIEEQCILFSN